MIRLAHPSVGEEDIEAVARVLRTGYLVQGRCVSDFESAIASLVGTRHAVAVSSGTAALHLSLLALGVGNGDRVAVPAYTWPATANVVALCGAEVIFVDIEPQTLGIDPDGLEQAIKRQGPIKAVMPVHVFGGMANMPAIVEQAEGHGVLVIEDAACALGARLRQRAAGSWGALGCFSFHPRKIISTGEGGAITTDDPALARTLRTLRNHGIDPLASAPDFVMPGFNYRLTEFQGAMGLTQLAKLHYLLQQRRVSAEQYDLLFRGSRLTRPGPKPPAHVHQAYVVILPEEAVRYREQIIQRLRAEGVEATIGTHHVPLTTYWARRLGHRAGDFPVTDAIAAQALALPLHDHLTSEEQQFVAAAVQREVHRSLRDAKPSPQA